MSLRQERAQEVIRAYSPALFRLFARYLDRYFASNFTAIRILEPGFPGLDPGRPAIFFGNHVGWWDPILYLLLSARLLPERRSFGPIDAGALDKYRFLRRIGLFPVEQESRRGAVDFLMTSKLVLAEPGTCLWLTPQGRFSDVRERPVVFKAGVAHLAREMPDAQLVPVAVEYPFWTERRPEVVVHFGPVIEVSAHPDLETEDWHALLEGQLTGAMDRLAVAAIARDETAFRKLMTGRVGVSPVYDAWRWVRAKLSRRHFSPAHKD